MQKRIEVYPMVPTSFEKELMDKAKKYLNIQLEKVWRFKFYLLDGQDNDLNHENLNLWGKEIFSDEIIEEFALNAPAEFKFPDWFIEISFRPGVTDNIGHTASEAIDIISRKKVSVYSGEVIGLWSNISKDEVQHLATELLANELLQKISVFNQEEFLNRQRFEHIHLPQVILEEGDQVSKVSLDKTDDELIQMSQAGCLALSLPEMKFIKNFYQDKKFLEERKKFGLSGELTDVELEVIAQSWSEHCKHKIFSSNIEYSECDNHPYQKIPSQKIESLYKSFIKGATKIVSKDRNWLVSVFSDNAGIVRFDPKIDLCIKVETHNSPSALDPYGGALTGILGVNRDILGVGLGGRPIGNTDVFCFGPTDLNQELPDRLKHPRRIFEGVHKGIEDGGNKSGIPTVNGAISFHPNFSGKPLVFCGTVGVLPAVTPQGNSTSLKTPLPGDAIFMAGGKIGADGIHGATFSSLELSEDSPATAVQIGDPITQKRVLDFTIEARDLGLFTCITDNGAGGLSSSVGEMATLTNGAKVDLSQAPVKYPGLKPFELMISESQERMTYGVPQNKIELFEQLAKKRNVEVSQIGEFTNTGYLEVFYENIPVALLDLHFLHEALIPMQLKADWQGPQISPSWYQQKPKPKLPHSVFEALINVLSAPNVQSKESYVRQFDHEVQGSTVIKPFAGKSKKGPNDSGVLWLGPHGGSEKAGAVVSCGILPRASYEDTYLASQLCLDEAVRNAVAVGANPEKIALVDNFCWPDPVPGPKNPDAQHKLAQLVRSCIGLYDMAVSYKMPFVSGKDSMKNDYIGKFKGGQEVKISVPPTLLITALSYVENLDHRCSSDFKAAGDLIYVVGKSAQGMKSSELDAIYDFEAGLMPAIDMEKNILLYQDLHRAHQLGFIRSCHDVSEGGMLVSIVESMIGGALGARLDNQNIELVDWFNEASGRFVISVDQNKKQEVETHFKQHDLFCLGSVSENLELTVADESISIDVLIKAWSMS